MPSITFRTSRHIVRDVGIVEVWYGDIFIATICPPPMGDIAAFSIISKYLDTEQLVIDTGLGGPPAMVVQFDMTRDT